MWSLEPGPSLGGGRPGWGRVGEPPTPYLKGEGAGPWPARLPPFLSPPPKARSGADPSPSPLRPAAGSLAFLLAPRRRCSAQPALSPDVAPHAPLRPTWFLSGSPQTPPGAAPCQPLRGGSAHTSQAGTSDLSGTRCLPAKLPAPRTFAPCPPGGAPQPRVMDLPSPPRSWVSASAASSRPSPPRSPCLCRITALSTG